MFEKKTNSEKTGKPVVAGEDGTQDGDSNNENSSVNGSALGSGKTARDVVTPLAHMSYTDQLEHKKSSISHLLKKLVSVSPLIYFNIFRRPSYLKCYRFQFFRLEMHAKLVQMVFHSQNGFLVPEKEVAFINLCL